MSTPEIEVIIIRDQEGNYYALPATVLHNARVSGEEARSVAQLAAGDTSTLRGQVTTKPDSYEIVSTLALAGGAVGSVVAAAGYYFQFLPVEPEGQ